MSAEVETMAYAGETPWHGLGYKVEGNLTPKQMLKTAKLDWTVERRQLYMEGGVEVPAAALVRSTDNRVLGIVGPVYTPTQNAEAFEFFNEFVNAGGASMETAGSLMGGQYVWGLAALKESFTLKGKDTVRGYLMVACPHKQGKSLVAKMTGIRVVCWNTYSQAMNAKSGFRHIHRTEFDAAAIERAKETLDIARQQFDTFGENAKKLQAMSMTRQDAINTLAPVFSKDKAGVLEEELSPRMHEVMQALDNAPGAQADNAWGILNAATYYVDHMACRTADRRLTQSWFGKGEVQKQAVMKALLEA